jgi:uncharacterized membrane protein
MSSESSPGGIKLSRIEALSDGVFAIAMTLLILEVKVPVHDLVNSENDLATSLLKLGPKLFSYFLSFIVLGIFWVAQNAQFAFIKHSDRELLWINIVFLMFISFLPFSTAVLGDFLHYQVSVLVYWMNLFFIGFSLLWNWLYAKRQGYIPILKENPNLDKIVKKRVLVAQLFYFMGLLASFINTYLSMAFFMGIQLVYILPSFWDKALRNLYKTEKNNSGNSLQ